MPEATAPLRFRSARRAILAAYVGHAVRVLMGGLGITFIVGWLPESWHWIGPWLIGLLVASMVIEPIWSHAFTTYTVTADAVVEQAGRLHRRVKTLRWNRVQAIDRDTDWRLRLFGLATLTVAQAGQEAARIEIRAIDAAMIERVLAAARAGGASEASAPTATDDEQAEPGAATSPEARATAAEAAVLYRASLWDIAVMSVMFGTVILAAPAMAFGAWEVAERWGLGEGLRSIAGGIGPLGAAAIVVVLVVLLGIARTVVTHHRFTVRRVGGTLQIQHGLLTTRERSFRESSIQGVVVQRNLLEQLTGRARLWLLTLDSDDHLGKNLVLPSLPLRVVERVARESFPSRVPAGPLLARRPRVLTALGTTVLALAVAVGTYAALAMGLGWAPLFAGICALVTLAIVSGIGRVLLARIDVDAGAELLLLRRTYVTESLRAVDLSAIRRVRASRVPAWLAPTGHRLLPSVSIYAGKRATLRALHAAPAAVEHIRATAVLHAPRVAAETLARHRA